MIYVIYYQYSLSDMSAAATPSPEAPARVIPSAFTEGNQRVEEAYRQSSG